MSSGPFSSLVALAGLLPFGLAPSMAFVSTPSPSEFISMPSAFLSLHCTPTRAGTTYFTNTCRLVGRGFHPHESVQITYTVSSGASKTTYRRTTVTDGCGAFARPAFWFTVDPRKGGFGLNVVAIGARRDRATTGVGVASIGIESSAAQLARYPYEIGGPSRVY